MRYITAVHMSTGGTLHEHIARVKWLDPASSTGEDTTATMVDWIDNKNGVAKVKSPAGDVSVGTVAGTPRYLRTHADGKWTNNLLALPRF